MIHAMPAPDAALAERSTEDVAGMNDRESDRKIRRDETVAVMCGTALALLVVLAVLVYLWVA